MDNRTRNIIVLYLLNLARAMFYRPIKFCFCFSSELKNVILMTLVSQFYLK